LLEYPNASYLYFLKGSLYAKQKQWNAAQASFFEAWQRDNKNADLACNLAIALDHLNQPKEAARFYHQALELATNHPGFSVEAIQRRLHELEATKQ
jgi:Flp pilus assembly protein TadD